MQCSAGSAVCTPETLLTFSLMFQLAVAIAVTFGAVPSSRAKEEEVICLTNENSTIPLLPGLFVLLTAAVMASPVVAAVMASPVVVHLEYISDTM